MNKSSFEERVATAQTITAYGGSLILAERFLASVSGRTALRRLGRQAAVAMGLGALVGSAMLAWNLYEAYQLYVQMTTTETHQHPITDHAGVDSSDDETDQIFNAHHTADDDPGEEAAGPDCSTCGADIGIISCEGDPSDSFCSDCFNHYAVGAFQAGGVFCARITSNEIESQRGVLPCPFFLAGECSCHTIPDTVQIEHLSPQALEQRDRALGRIAEGHQEEPRQGRQDQGREELETERSFNLLLNEVLEVLSLGLSVACPHCGRRGGKDDACMHITCANLECRHHWCYCCGRTREGDDPNRCQTCDRNHLFMEHFPGWENLVVEPGESRGYGALHEFHRRRIAYFLRRLREAVPEAPWEELWTQRSNLLLEVPTTGRSITHRDIATAEPPVFSSTTVTDILWLNEVDPVIERLQQAFPEVEERNEHIPQEVLDAEELSYIEDVLLFQLLRGEEQQQQQQEPPREPQVAGRPRRRRRWGRFWRRAPNRRRPRRRPAHTQAATDTAPIDGDDNQARRQVDQGRIDGDEEVFHVQRLAEEIRRNNTLDEDMRQVMLESLLNPFQGNPFAVQDLSGDGNPQIEGDLETILNDIHADEILRDDDIDDELRQVMLESLADPVQHHEANVHGQTDEQVAEAWNSINAAEAILSDARLDNELRQAMLDSLAD